MIRIPTPRAELAMRVYLACGVACIALGYVALWWAYGWLPVVVVMAICAGLMVGVGGWMHRFPGGDE